MYSRGSRPVGQSGHYRLNDTWWVTKRVLLTLGLTAPVQAQLWPLEGWSEEQNKIGWLPSVTFNVYNSVCQHDISNLLKLLNMYSSLLPYFGKRKQVKKSDIPCKRAKCVCHLHWSQWNIMMYYLTYLLIRQLRQVFLDEIWPGRRVH